MNLPGLRVYEIIWGRLPAFKFAFAVMLAYSLNLEGLV